MSTEEAGRAMRVLFLSCHLPLPAVSGGRRREYELVRRLSSEVDIDLVAVSKTPAEDAAFVPHMRRYCREVTVFPALGTVRRAATAAGVPRQVQRHAAPSVLPFLRGRLSARGYDIVHVEGYYLMQHVPRGGPRVVLGTQNVEHTLIRQAATLATTAGDRSALAADGELTRHWERAALARAAGAIAVTGSDSAQLADLAPGCAVWVVPNGADHDTDIATGSPVGIPPRHGPDPPRVAFVANFGYAPNVDAAGYLLHAILPLLRARQPGVEAYLVGNAPPSTLVGQATRACVVVTGRVSSLRRVYQAIDLVMFPLRIGGGVKTKVLEAVRAGVPIVTTSVGTQGLDDRTRRGLVIADTADRFAAEVADLIAHPRRRAVLSAAARTAARSLPSWNQAAWRLLSCYRHVLAQKVLGN